MFRIADRLLRYHEDRLRPPMEVLDNPLGCALLRRAADSIALWRACELKACYRARRCRRKRGACLPGHAHLMTPELGAYAMDTLRCDDPQKYLRWAAKSGMMGRGGHCGDGGK